MKKHFYLDNFNLDLPLTDFSLEQLYSNPILFTSHSREFFYKKNMLYTEKIIQAIRDKAPVVHIKSVCKKYYEISTPYSGKVEINKLKDLVLQMFGTIGVMDNFPILYKDENENIIRAVAPRIDSYHERSSQSPYTDLDWHVDAAYRPIMKKNQLSPMPDYLIFGIVHKGHENLPIIYVTLKDILSQLNGEDIAIGLSPEFSVLSADSFANRIVTKDIALLVKDDNYLFHSRITLQNAKPQTARAAYFLQKIKSILTQPIIQNRVNVEAGDIVILNNKTTLHKRDSYQPKWDGKDRYFIRVYSVKDLNQGICTDSEKQWEWC